MVYTSGKTAGSTRAAGRTENSTERASTSRLTDRNAEAFGKTANASSGSTNSDCKSINLSLLVI